LEVEVAQGDVTSWWKGRMPDCPVLIGPVIC
jgi:hypothetical protein